ncbi:uncharacterized protein LOC126680395 [Mercurialis annua]|uniref:uncharacterized protein LOC126680395 n=1 Tax=Mercurialis annua TaxID=3986 RepID=UPI00215F7E4D|nr:uncharacterized protein LOC126680395 [Mercurialis annua]
MAVRLPLSSLLLFTSPQNKLSSPTAIFPHSAASQQQKRQQQTTDCGFRLSYRYNREYEDGEADGFSFDEAVALFNRREYYKCHDFLEALWTEAQDPTRTLLHAILQCAVAFHHLFNQNHKGAMMELGEGVCKLRKLDFKSGPFHQFEQEISALLQFIYQTQIELAACSDDLCEAIMDQSERSYQLLGGYAAGEVLYTLETDAKDESVWIVFCPRTSSVDSPRVKLPTLNATQQHLTALNTY